MDFEKFEYFQGAVGEMAHVAEGEQQCTFCARTGLCFDLGATKHGCFDCLRRGRFLFGHTTEIGQLTSDGLVPLRRGHEKIPEHFNRVAFAALLKTPQFTTWQGEEWLIHCDDFMVYLGEWKPQDFRQAAEDGDGRKLFARMTEKDLAHLWDDSIPQGGNEPAAWYATYYAFRCRSCGVLRGYWDCP